MLPKYLCKLGSHLEVHIMTVTTNNQFHAQNPSVDFFFSAPERKAHVHYCDHALSVVRPSCVGVNFSNFRFLL